MQKIFKQPMRTKRGSSLPMVLAIGLVLVIWVMGLTPIITTQGKASIDVQNQEEDYLQSRSAIEFTKGELVNMVAEQGFPETFAVVYDVPSGKTEPEYIPVNKVGSLSYNTYIQLGASDDLDTPFTEGVNKELGDKVAAICAVKEPSGGNMSYIIQVTTYNGGEKGLSFNTSFTPKMTSSIYPEAYKKTQALPISDFVLVDGKLGGEVLWDSPLTNGDDNDMYIDYIVEREDSGDDSFHYASDDYKEILMPGSLDSLLSGGKYPTVFKFTATAEDINRPGANDNNPDLYSVVQEPDAPALKVESQKIDRSWGSYYLSVTLNNVGSNAKYAYSTSSNPGTVSWNTSRTFTINLGSNPNEGTYYFYSYIPAHKNETDKILCGDSKVAVVPVQVLKVNTSERSSFDSNKRYIMSNSNKIFYVNNSALATQSNQNLVAYADNMGWRVENGNEFSIWDPIYNRYTYLNYSANQFYLGNNIEPFIYEKQTKYGWNFYVLHQSGQARFLYAGSNFCTDKFTDAGLTFYEVTPPPPGTAPSRPSVSVTVESVTENLTLKKLKERYKKNCESAGLESVEVFVVPGTGSTFDVYAIAKKNSTPWLGLLHSGVTIPNYTAPTGYGIMAESLYFMDSDYAFNTNGEDIYLKADLLVIGASEMNKSAGGRVILKPYTPSKSSSLVFFVEDNGCFEGKNFYRIPSAAEGTNLLDVDPDVVESEWRLGSPTYDEDGSFVLSSSARNLMRSGAYPTINLDVAYATDEQIAHIVSSEATGWTVGGKLAVNNTDDNGRYVVCTYVTDITGAVTCSANRIMFATPTGSPFAVGYDMQLCSRYVSFDSNIIKQGQGDVSLILKSMTENNNFWGWISEALGTNANYNSQTIQVEYEQPTKIVLSSNAESETLTPQICRYKSGVNLFENPEVITSKAQDLPVTYTVTQLNDKFQKTAVNISTAERYLEITAGSDDTMNVRRKGSLLSWVTYRCQLDLYANYIAFDSSVQKINLPYGVDVSDESYVSYSDVRINSQESGYTENDYLFFFHENAADTYNGTLLQIKGATLTVTQGSTSYKMDRGLYFIPAQDDGTSIYDIAKDVHQKQAARKAGTSNEYSKYEVTEEEYRTYAESLEDSKAFVETGIENLLPSDLGFGGGSVN